MKSILVLTAFLLSFKAFSAPGYLILAHGSMKMSGGGGHHFMKTCHNNNPSQWEKAVLDSVSNIRGRLNYKSEVAFGMWSTKCIEAGIARLKNKMTSEGETLDHIIVLPVFISSHSAVIEMQKFIFKKRADRVIPLPHVTQTKFEGKITYLKAMDYHPLVSLILKNRLNNLIKHATLKGFSKDQMDLILVMHGPVGEMDNEKWMEMGNNYRKDLTEQLSNTASSFVVSLRDDAEDDVRNQATKEFRSHIQKSSKEGRTALILPLLLSKGGIEKGIIKRIKGLKYNWLGEMLLPDTLLEKFLLKRLQDSSI